MTFKINYKGTDCRGIKYTYICQGCGHEHDERHTASANPLIDCPECFGAMNKKPTAPAFDADHHDSMKSWNLGWEGDNGKD